MKNIGVFKPKADSLNNLYVLIPYKSLEKFTSTNEAFQNLQIPQENGGEYLSGTNNDPPYKGMSTILLKAFKDMQGMKPSPVKWA